MCFWKNSTSTLLHSRQPPADLSGKVLRGCAMCVTASHWIHRRQDAVSVTTHQINELRLQNMLWLPQRERGFVLLFLIPWPPFSGFKRLLRALKILWWVESLLCKHKDPSSIPSSYMKIWAVCLKPKH